jgi:hypothetical protein
MSESHSPFDGDTYPKYRLHFLMLDNEDVNIAAIFNLNIEINRSTDPSGEDPFTDEQITALEGYLTAMYDALKEQPHVAVFSVGEPSLVKYDEVTTTLAAGA